MQIVLFMVAWKWGMFGAAGGRIICHVIPTVALLVPYFRGTFGGKPDWRGLFKKFSVHPLPAIRVGISEFVISPTGTVSGIFIRKYMGMCAERNHQISFDDALTGFNSVSPPLGIAVAVPGGLCIGMLPELSYANAAAPSSSSGTGHGSARSAGSSQ
jgi:hypothetical protein